MMKVGITGQAGFAGTHLHNTLGLFPAEFERVPFEDRFFENAGELEAFVKECDCIVHLAAMNRHTDPQVIYDTNLRLVRQLVMAMENTGSRPHVVFSSSTQEEKDNAYGKSKKEGREMLTQWAVRNKAPFTGMVIPNVFGPFGNPHYNSVIATFSHQLTHGEVPKIDIDGNLKLIYVAELVMEIMAIIRNRTNEPGLRIPYTREITVSEILELLNAYKEDYFEKGIIPPLGDHFERNLFNTFRSFIDPLKFFPFRLAPHTDPRGSFTELIRLGTGGQVSFSTTNPGITRGNHFHTRKIERFAIIRGQARIRFRRIGTSEIFTFDLDGKEPSFVDMPVWYTHNITNTGSDDLYTIFWINEFYDSADPDTYFEEVELLSC